MKKLILFIIILIFPCSLIYSQNTTTIHVKVALCDNKYQGIVKVPKLIGNGQDPDNNLYWGCGFGIRTYFKKSQNWKEIKRCNTKGICLERIVFKHKTAPYYLVVDAYDGKYIKQCTVDFLNACAGLSKDTLIIDNKTIGIKGNSKLIAYIGHNGLMDFKLPDTYKNKDNLKRDAIILACASKQYFAPYLKSANSNPILWTTNLMCPEAYTIHDAIDSYIKSESAESIRNSAAKAYSKFQKCSIGAAKRLLVTGY